MGLIEKERTMTRHRAIYIEREIEKGRNNERDKVRKGRDREMWEPRGLGYQTGVGRW